MTSPTSGNTELIPIKSSTRTVQTCFQSCLYVVPNFQRPYSWDIDELDDYWADVVEARGDFFFGSTVTWESQSRELFNNSYSIIDGQQRLTTSAIILSVIRDSFQNLARELTEHDSTSELVAQARAQADNTQRYLVITDDDGVKYPVIQRDEPNFREVVQEPGAIPSLREWNGSAFQIGVARKYFEVRVQDRVESDELENRLDVLKGIRNNVLKARLIQVELSSEEDGFLIFETLNTRGADLRLADLIKNLLVRGGATEEGDRAAVSTRWERLVARVQPTSDAVNSVDQFIWQSWNSRREAVTEAELYKEISRRVKGDAGLHLGYLAELEFDSISYQYIGNDEFAINRGTLGSKSALRVLEVSDTLRALALFNVSVANSAILAIVRKYEDSNLLTKAQLIGLCSSIENFHFQFTALKNSGSTGGTRGRYNRFAVELENASSKASVRTSISTFNNRLAASLPAREEAKAAFATLFYAPAVRLNNAQKRRSRKLFIAYVLLRLAQMNNALPSGQDLNAWTIEHIRPQSLANGHFSDSEYSIGNLALLTSGANGVLADGNFFSKRSGLRSYVPWHDDKLQSWLDAADKNEIVSADIEARAAALAVLAVDSVWAIHV